MAEFPRTEIGGLSVSRLLIGTNWILGFSHKSHAKDKLIVEHATREMMADIFEVYLREGVDTMVGGRPDPKLNGAMKDAEDRVGRPIISVGTPHLDKIKGTAKELQDEMARHCEAYAKHGTKIIMPHTGTTEQMIDDMARTLRRWDEVAPVIREHGMIPGIASHPPEAMVYADEQKLDFETVITIYNAIGFLMHIEIEWVHRVIHECSKPIITIKPMAAGRLTPLAGLAFAWSTIRPQDMVCAGAMTPDEARELIDLSRSFIERTEVGGKLTWSRSKMKLAKK